MQNVLVSYPGTISLKVKSNYVLKILRVTLNIHLRIDKQEQSDQGTESVSIKIYIDLAKWNS